MGTDTRPRIKPRTEPSVKNGDRGKDGKFKSGNKAAVGVKQRTVQRFREILMAAVTERDLWDVTRKLVERAKAGSLEATKLLLLYVAGRPGPAIDYTEDEFQPDERFD